jgi:3-phenylpropionate/trans-cinnamate dioxygenase ferredoxin reductase subunit
VSLAGGGDLPYDKLLLATGSRVRRIPAPGADLANIFYLRGLDDCLAIQSRLTPGARLVVVGGGYIGLEAAATARARDCAVTVIEMQDQVLARVAAPELGQFFAEAHRDSGVDIRCGLGVAGFEGAGRVERVLLADGTSLAADVVVVGIGIAPGTELAEAAGLAVDNGILVDEGGRSSDPHIFAAGDVTSHPNPLLGRRVRLESWQNAQNQAIAAAKAMCGQEVAYAEVPWFWSDQYDLNLQMLGLPETWDHSVQRGDMGARSFTMFYLSQGRLVAASAVNSAKDIAVARRLIQSAKPVDAAALADPEVRLKTLL